MQALDMDALSGAQMEELWGVAYQEDYSRIRGGGVRHQRALPGL